MAFGLGVLRLTSSSFWDLTLKELNAAIAGATGAAWLGEPINRIDLGALMRRFPDANNQQDD